MTEMLSIDHHTRLSADDVRALRRIARSTGLLPARMLFAAVPAVIERRLADRLIADAGELFTLVQRLPELLFGGDVGRFMEAAGFTSAEQRLLQQLNPGIPSKDPALFPLRWDFVLTEDGPKLLEVNVTPHLGGINTDPLQYCYDRFAGGSAQPWWPASEPWLAALQRRTGPWGGSDAVGLIEADNYRDLCGFGALQLSNCLSQVCSAILTPCRPHDVEIREQVMRCGAEPLHHLVELFSFTDTGRYEALSRYVAAVASGRHKPTVSMWCEVLNSKAVLALCCEYADRASGITAERVRQLIPRTTRLTNCTDAELLAQRAELVLKPGRSKSGRGIVFGAEQTSADWLRQCHDRKASDPSAVVQTVVHRIGRMPQTWVAPDGTVTTGQATPVLGLVLIDGAPAGGVARFAAGDPLLVSGSRGAGVGIIRMCDS